MCGTASVVCSEFYRWKIWEVFFKFRWSANIQLFHVHIKNVFLGKFLNPTVRCKRIRKLKRHRWNVLKWENRCCNFVLRAGICEPSHGKSCEVGSAVPHQLFSPCLCPRKKRTIFSISAVRDGWEIIWSIPSLNRGFPSISRKTTETFFGPSSISDSSHRKQIWGKSS